MPAPFPEPGLNGPYQAPTPAASLVLDAKELPMDVTVLSVPGCPNVGLLVQRLAQVLDGGAAGTVTCLVIADEQEAIRLGMHGSPTILVDGIDPFAGTDAPASMSCRLYPGGDGAGGGVPSVQALRHVFQARLTPDVSAAPVQDRSAGSPC